MKRNPLFRQSLAALAACAMFLVSAGAFAQGATITLSDPNCSDFSLGGSAGARTLTCLVNTAPVCTVTGPNAGTINSQITLNASCSPAATSWSWTGGACAGLHTQNCQDPGTGYSNNQVVSYTVAGTNGAFVGSPSLQFNVTWTNSPPAAPSGCSLSPGASTQSAGYQATFNVTCSGGGAPTGWAWTGSGTAGCNTASCGPITFNSTTTISVTPSNAGGNGNQASSKITIGGGGGGGGGGGALNCTTQLQAHGWANAGPTISLVDPADTRYFTSSLGGLAPNGALVIKFTTSAATTSSAKGVIQLVGAVSSQSERVGALNTTPCDFDTGLPLYSCAGQTTRFDTEAPTVQTWQSTSTNRPCAVQLQPNTTYYFNLYNAPAGNCIVGGSCEAAFDFKKPGGT
jgi:hypothetical protein